MFSPCAVDAGYLCFYYLSAEGLACCVVTSEDYPKRVAFGIISDLLAKFEAKIP